MHANRTGIAAVATWPIVTMFQGLPSVHAADACEIECSAACDPRIENGSSGCQVCLTGCWMRQREGSRGPARPLAPSAQWGYIVFDTATGRWGSSAGRRVGVEARGLASEACRRAGGQRCDWKLPIQAGCVVVAEGRHASGRAAHQRSGSDERAFVEAATKALAACRAQGGRDYRRVAAVCSWDTQVRR